MTTQTVSEETGTQLPRWPFQRPSPMAMPAEYARLRAEQPVIRVQLMTGDQAWLLSRYDDVKMVLADPRFSPRQPAGPLGPQATNSSSLFQDPPAHTRLRGLVSRAFTARRVEGVRPFARQLSHELVDELMASGQGGDLMSTVAFRMPVDTIAELLGVPQADRGAFRDASTALIMADERDVEMLREAGPKVHGMVRETVAEKRRRPADDLLSALIAVRDENQDRLTEDELVTMGMTLLIAGFVATANSIGLGTVLLAEVDGIRALHDDPSLVPGAVEEILRYEPKVSGPARMAKVDVELHGVLIQAGDLVMVPEQSANRDERQFRNADVFDIRRTDGNQHIAFGHGIHHCLGAALARVQLQETFGALSSRLPGLRPAVGLDELVWRMNFFGDNRFRLLPVNW
jgi:cytochrome P450